MSLPKAAEVEISNPSMAGNGCAGPHSDSCSTNRSPYPGPGAGPVNSHLSRLGACPTMMVNQRGFPIGNFVDGMASGEPFRLQRSLRILDPTDLTVLAALPLTPIGVDGLYNYLDNEDRVVLGDGSGHVLRVAQRQDTAGRWELAVVDDWDVGHHIIQHHDDDRSSADYIVSVKPDWDGRIWFSTTGGVLGTLEPDTGRVGSMKLPAGEQVIKAISSSPAGVAVVSDHALYLLRAGADGRPQEVWREAYDRGSEVKGGQRNQGSGTAPVFFGDGHGDHVAIMDNAAGRGNLVVYRTAGPDENRLICQIPLFTTGASATDDTFIAFGRSLIATNTFGYNYYEYTAPLVGGITRVDVRPDKTGGDVVWTSPVATTTVPKLSAPTGLIHLIDRAVLDAGNRYSHVAIDVQSGTTVGRSYLGSDLAYEGIQSCGALGPDGSYYQGTVAGMVRIASAADSISTT